MITQLDKACQTCASASVSEYLLLKDDLLECGKTGKLYMFEGKDFSIRLASETKLEVGDKVLYAHEDYVEYDDYYVHESRVDLHTIVQFSEDGGILYTESLSLSASNCFKILNPEVLEQ